MHRVAIMQPYFLPYIGYWQLIAAVDKFVVYDDVEFTKKGWFHRNRYLVNGKDVLFTIPLKNDSDYLSVGERYLSGDCEKKIIKIHRQFEAAYKKAPFFDDGMQILQRVLFCKERNLFAYNLNSINVVCEYLGINTEIVISSSVAEARELKGVARVLSICEALGARQYINPIGGVALYSKDLFASRGVALSFQQVRPYMYKQVGSDLFVSHLSILDVVMNAGRDYARCLLGEMDLV